MRTPPSGVWDVFDRQMMVVNTGHWTWKTMAGLATMTLILVAGVGGLLGLIAYFLNPAAGVIAAVTGASATIPKLGSLFRRGPGAGPGAASNPAV
ncbi:hypothetical protein AB0L82_35505 [Nocardia sp. NPDC052001]|uniref:hypothetical protein n=1 Tax=Nocardia sp. NPDC052001 TaxID=3154853 RepID=UPI00342787FB